MLSERKGRGFSSGRKSQENLNGHGFPGPAAFTPLPAECYQQVADGFVLLGLAAQWHVGVETIADAPPLSLFGDVSVGFQIVDNIARGFFRDAYRRGNFAGGYERLLGNEVEYQGMVGQELPARHTLTSLSKTFVKKYSASFRYNLIKLLTIFTSVV